MLVTVNAFIAQPVINDALIPDADAVPAFKQLFVSIVLAGLNIGYITALGTYKMTVPVFFTGYEQLVFIVIAIY